MTVFSTKIKKKEGNSRIKSLLSICLFFLAILFSNELKKGAAIGFKLCFYNILPSLFPFFVLSDYLTAVIKITDKKENSFLFNILRISKIGLSDFLIGNLCGFPLGAKAASSHYKENLIDENELENLSVISSNPSCAFVISGVGLGLFRDARIGIMLYVSILASAFIIGMLFNKKISKCVKSSVIFKQNFDLITSIKVAGQTCIVVSSYIIFFSSLIGVAKHFIKSSLLLSILSAILEVGSACNTIADNSYILKSYTLPLISFSLAFSGLSVFMQCFAILPSFVSKKRYLIKKLLQGIISAFITSILLNV